MAVHQQQQQDTKLQQITGSSWNGSSSVATSVMHTSQPVVQVAAQNGLPQENGNFQPQQPNIQMLPQQQRPQQQLQQFQMQVSVAPVPQRPIMTSTVSSGRTLPVSNEVRVSVAGNLMSASTAAIQEYLQNNSIEVIDS
jgi:hypothetical protein